MKTLTASIDTLLGPVRLAATADGLSGLWFRGQQHEPPADPAAATMPVEHYPVLRRAADWITAYFAGEPEMPRPALAPRGTSFQRAVWDALLAIPRGNTVSYAALARSLGAPQATRAVAAAVGRNPVSLLIPCHRVVGSDGSLTGYAGGLGRKRACLDLEQGRGLPWRTIGSAYAPQYPDPIAVDVGERVSLPGSRGRWRVSRLALGRGGRWPMRLGARGHVPRRERPGYRPAALQRARDAGGRRRSGAGAR
jgi:methylated-DNA-[protein]-cysteine S-methyltransferase